MTDRRPPHMTDSELQRWRDEQIEQDRRRWLFKALRTWVSWIAGALTATLVFTGETMKLIELWYKK